MDKQVKTLHPSFEPLRIYIKALWDQMCTNAIVYREHQRKQQEREAAQNSRRRNKRVFHAPQMNKTKPPMALAKMMSTLKES